MNYAIIALGGQQHQITVGQIIQVPNLNKQPGDKFELSEVLLLNQDDQITVGTPYLPDCKIQLEVVENLKGKKVRVYKYKAKSRYNKTLGFRPQLTHVKVTQIGTIATESKPKSTKAKPATPKTTTKKTVKKTAVKTAK